MAHEEPLGRSRELERIDQFLDAAASHPAALTLTGPAGIGKTTVWREACHRATAMGYRVLSTAPTESEARFSFAGLRDIFATLDASELDALPGVQRRAIDVALLRADVDSDGVESQAVAAAVLSVLTSIAKRTPIVLAVDDAQWLDDATSEVLAFAVRRIDNERLVAVVSVRVDPTRPRTFEMSIPHDWRSEISLGPLSAAALHDIVKVHVDVVLPRPSLVQVVAASGGNAFYAVEIARELVRTGLPRPGARLPLPSELRTLVRSRVARLPTATRGALLVAACLAQPTSALVDVDQLVPAEEAGIVHIDADGRITFDHPLLAAAVYESASWPQRRAVHRTLAQKVDDPEQRALHLARAADAPDEEVAAALDVAAQRAAGRGAKRVAARLARRAIELSPPPPGRAAIERTIAAADYDEAAGDSPAETIRLIEAALGDCDDSDLRAELLYRLGVAQTNDARPDAALHSLQAALRDARDPILQARIHAYLPWVLDTDKRAAIDHCDAVLGLIDEDTDPFLYFSALLMGTYLRLVSGLGADDAALERARQKHVAAIDISPVSLVWPMLHDDFAESRARYEFAIDECRKSGEERREAALLANLAELELLVGDWKLADVRASQALELSEQLGAPRYLNSALFVRGYVDAHLGRVEAARERAESMLTMAFDNDGAYRILGFLSLSTEEFVAADEEFSQCEAYREAKQEWEPARYRFHPDLIEAAIMHGDIERAEKLTEWMDARAPVFPRPWILAMAARCHGLLFAARGDLDGAKGALQEALRHHDQLLMPFERARTQLLFGQLLRRRLERREAREQIGMALREFERLGAALWTERARAELERTRVRRAPLDLTPTEEKIARLAAVGLTNREVAERAFISVKTVEANLSRVYDKLDVRSRAELGRVMANRAGAGAG